MQNGLHFISGLPRSGSTLLAAILRQNPRIHAGMSSPVGALFRNLMQGMSSRGEMSVMLTSEQREDVLRGLFDNYYKDLHHDEGCARHQPCLVRQDGGDRETVPRRPGHRLRAEPGLDHGFLRADPAQGSAADLQDVPAARGCHGLYPRKLSCLRIGNSGFRLERCPGGVSGASTRTGSFWSIMKRSRVNQRGRPSASTTRSDFPLSTMISKTSVTRMAADLMQQLGVPGLHTVAGRVQFVERPTILPPDLYQRFSGRNFWRRPRANTRNVAVVLPSQLRSPGFAREAALDVSPVGGNLNRPTYAGV